MHYIQLTVCNVILAYSKLFPVSEITLSYPGLFSLFPCFSVMLKIATLTFVNLDIGFSAQCNLSLVSR